MKKYLTYAIAAFFATTVVAIASPEAEMMLQSKEKAAWQAFKDKKADDFKKVVRRHGRPFTPMGSPTCKKRLDDDAKMDMKSFSLSDFTVVMTDANTAIVTYKAKIEGHAWAAKTPPAITTPVRSGK